MLLLGAQQGEEEDAVLIEWLLWCSVIRFVCERTSGFCMEWTGWRDPRAEVGDEQAVPTNLAQCGGERMRKGCMPSPS
jgi:hypothetical protein